MQIPDELWADIRAMAEARMESALADIDMEIASMAENYATRFIDVSTVSDEGKVLQHLSTGRVLKIKAEWDG